MDIDKLRFMLLPVGPFALFALFWLVSKLKSRLLLAATCVMLAGACMNYAVIFANGKMPVDIQMTPAQESVLYTQARNEMHYRFLCDRIPIGNYAMASPGDVTLLVGLLLAVIGIWRMREKPEDIIPRSS